MSNKTIYISDSLNFSSIPEENDFFLQIIDGVNVNDNEENITESFFQAVDIIGLNDNNQTKETGISINEDLAFSEDKNFEDLALNFNESVNFQDQQKKSNLEEYSFSDWIEYSERWSDSDIVVDNKIIYSRVNFIVVNDITYNTKNISYYKFTVDDKFNFFIGNKVKKTFSESPMFGEIGFVTKVDSMVFSNIDGELINNGVTLSEGSHKLKYKLKNTCAQMEFDLIVNEKFYQENDVLYEYNENDLYKAKLIRNHEIHKQEISISDDQIIFN